MATTTRETLATGASAVYIRHPAADDAGSWVRDGQPLDAGTASIIHNNLAVLRRESVRHLFSDLLPGTITSGDNNSGWSGLVGDNPPASQRTSTMSEIAWRLVGSAANARVYGPFPAVNDHSRDGIEDETHPRGVRVVVRAFGPADFYIYLAITPRLAPPTEGVAASTRLATNGTSTPTSPEDLDHTLECGRIAGPPTRRFAAGATEEGNAVIDVDEYYVWVGWKHPGAGTCGVLSVSAWETHG